MFCDYFFVPPAPPYAEETLESLFPRGCDMERALLSILDIRGESKNGIFGVRFKTHFLVKSKQLKIQRIRKEISEKKLAEEEKKFLIPNFGLWIIGS